jgi:hypothetical protein
MIGLVTRPTHAAGRLVTVTLPVFDGRFKTCISRLERSKNSLKLTPNHWLGITFPFPLPLILVSDVCSLSLSHTHTHTHTHWHTHTHTHTHTHSLTHSLTSHNGQISNCSEEDLINIFLQVVLSKMFVLHHNRSTCAVSLMSIDIRVAGFGELKRRPLLPFLVTFLVRCSK